ncbi:MAG: ABC transporter substrate-binding protein [Clostridia bacterium]|nr:ABC transporter substrate-binding protein [Clostridia bacterium]
MKKNATQIIALVLIACVAFAFAGCGPKAEAPKASETPKQETTKASEPEKKETKLDAIKKAGKIVLGTSADYAPYEFHAMIGGKDTIVGFDIEIAKEIAKELGVKLEIQDIGFDGLLQALNADKVDFVMAGMTPNEERKKSVDFSNIYYYAKQGVMVRSEDKDKYKTISDLKGKKVGAQLTTIQEKIVKEQMPEAKLVSLTKIPDLVLELKNKKVEAIVVELPVANGYVKKNADLAVSDIKVEEDTGGSAAAVKKGNPELVEAINKVLDRLIKDGSVDRFVAEANEMNEVK